MEIFSVFSKFLGPIGIKFGTVDVYKNLFSGYYFNRSHPVVYLMFNEMV